MKGAIIPCSTSSCHNSDWKKSLSNAVTKPEELLEILQLNSSDVGQGEANRLFPLRVPLPFVGRMELGNPNDPLFLQIWPQSEEFIQQPGFTLDPLEENQSNPVPGLLHKYGKRVLTISAASCAINCRYCFRRHFPYQEQSYSESTWQQWVHYIQQKPEINEVILSGGEPLLLSDDKLAKLITLLEQQPQIKRLRIHTRLPVVIPARINQRLMDLAKNSRLKWVMVWHINHPNEVDQSLADAAAKCRKANIYLLNQTVLMKRINDSAEVLEELSEKLFDKGIQPYYLHCPDKVSGTHHFYLSDSDIRPIYNELQSRLSGYLIPKLVREIAGKESKTLVIFPKQAVNRQI